MAATFGIAIRAILARQGARVFRAATRDIQRDATGAAVRVNQLNTSVKRLGGSFGLIARSAAGFIGSIAAIAGIRSTIRTIAEFDEATTRARVIMEKTRKDFEPFVEEFRRLAVETRFTATEIANFGAELAQAGFRGRDFIDVLKPSLNLAAAGAIELSKAQNIMIGTLSQWGFASTEATRVTNVLTKASFLTAASIEQIAEASRKAALLAKEVGLSFEETTAIVAILTENIRQAARAGTGFRGVMASLLAPSKEMQESFVAAGGTLEDFSIINGRLIKVMSGLKESSFGITNTTKLLGRESLIAGLIMQQSGDRMKGLGSQLENLGTFAEDAAKKFEDTLPGSFRRMISAITEAQLSLGDSGLLGVMRSVVDFTRDVVLALKGQTEGFINTKESVIAFKEALLAISGAFAALLTGKAIFAALAISINPITAALAVVIGAVILLRNETVEVGEVSTTVSIIIVSAWKSAADVIIDAIKLMIAELKTLLIAGRVFKNFFVDLFSGNLLTISPESIKSIDDFKESLDEVFKATSGLTASFNTIGTRFTSEIKKANDELSKLKKSAGTEFGPGASPGAGGTGSEGGGGDTTKVLKELTAQQRSLIEFTDELGDSFANAFGELITGAGTAIDVVKNLVNELAELIIKQTLLQPLANNISTGFANLLGGSQRGLNTFAPGSSNPASAFLEGQGQRFGSFTEDTAAGAALTTAATTAAGITTTAATTSSSLLTTGLTAASTTFSAAVTATGGSFTAAVAAAGASLVAAATAAGTALSAASVGATAFRTTGAAAAGSLGGGLHGAQFQAFAHGGVIGSPTFFRDGLAGEAGPEAILPLKRGSDGNLGVSLAGGSSVVVNMNIQTPNADSFRKSRRQIFSDIRRLTARLS